MRGPERERASQGAYSAGGNAAPPLRFDDEFRTELTQLFAWRRDVRRFREDPISDDIVEHLVATTSFAPSVGYSQPSRFVRVDDSERRARIIAEYERCNHEAAAEYAGEQQRRYAGMKLAGLREAPVHLAVFVDRETPRGSGLGRQTMPETLAYSTVLAIHTLWLMARAMGIGVGWVSILDPNVVTKILDVPASWSFVAYLCLGYPQEEHLDRELVRAAWESDDSEATRLHRR
ncbi:MAG: 5,6-dimethylbenzimidazole synthase [Vulcanimicrobiaceae bacterium]